MRIINPKCNHNDDDDIRCVHLQSPFNNTVALIREDDGDVRLEIFDEFGALRGDVYVLPSELIDALRDI